MATPFLVGSNEVFLEEIDVLFLPPSLWSVSVDGMEPFFSGTNATQHKYMLI